MDTHKEITATLATSSARKDERKLQAMIHARVVKTSSTAEFDKACKEFRKLVEEIKELVSYTKEDYSDFKGEYAKIASMQNPFNINEQLDFWLSFETTMRRLLAMDQECKYQGYKLGYSGNEWFKKCWKK